MSERDDSILKSYLGLTPDQQISDYQPEVESAVVPIDEVTPTVVTDPPVPTEEPVVTPEPVTPVVPVDEPPVVVPVVTENPKDEVKPWTPEFKSETDRYLYDKIMNGEEEDVYNTLHAKFAYKNMGDNEKIIAYLSATKPGLDKDDIAYLAAQKFGIDVTPIDEDTATAEELAAIRNQNIERKETLAKATEYFEQSANKVTLPTLPNPVDADTDYAEFKATKAQQAELLQQQQESTAQVNRLVDEAAPQISAIEMPVKINIDDSEFAVGVNFKLDDKKQKELAQYVKDRNPVEAEVAPYRKPDGTFDMKGYMQQQAQILYAPQILAAGIRQAIVQDREQNLEPILKNGTLRTTEGSQEHNEPVDFNQSYWSKRNGVTV